MGFRGHRRNSFVAALLAASALAAPAAAQGEAQGEMQDAVPPAEEQGDAGAREADLLRQLREAESPHAAGLVLAELHGLWSRSGSAAIDLLMRRGQDALEAGDALAAVEHFTAAADHAPGFAGAYAGRASALYQTGRVGPAIDDLREALALNPEDLDSLTGFAVILEELGRPEDALEVWARVADMNPQDEAAADAVARLQTAIEGLAL